MKYRETLGIKSKEMVCVKFNLHNFKKIILLIKKVKLENVGK